MTKPMLGIVLGAASFFVVFWVDAVSLKRVRFVKPALWLITVALSASGLVLAVVDSPRLAVPAVVSVAGWILTVAFGALLLYSLFIEIPFVSAYVGKGQPVHVVRRGTYALCRHPGVLWLCGFLAALFIATGALWLLAAMPVWVGLDALYVLLQEKIFFSRMFGAEYDEYRRTVPMLIPTARSARDCARTVFRNERA